MAVRVVSTWTCGRCGHEQDISGPTTTRPDGWIKVEATKVGVYRPAWHGRDLCVACVERLDEFMADQR
jgi:hypothetical protein